MKTQFIDNVKRWSFRLMILFITVVVSGAHPIKAANKPQQDDQNYIQLKGKIIDSKTNQPLVFATLALDGTNIATISNTDGEFALKVPESMKDGQLTASFLGYKNRQIPVASLKPERNRIELEMLVVSLHEINVFPRDPDLLIRAVLNKRKENYLQYPTQMTAFYRETIKKGRNYVSLSEAIVDIYKQPYSSGRSDYAKLFKARKSTDYTKLDTLVFKLQGGPHTTLLVDIMKNPYLLFTEDMSGNYEFAVANVTRINDRLIYVLEFKQRVHISEPLFYGKLYIDTESLAITSATFNLNTENKDRAAQMFIKRKPAGARVYPTEAAYLVNYRQANNGKWFMGYSRGQITFKVNWKKKLFNTTYASVVEMAITDWEVAEMKPFKANERIRYNIIMTDAISGFADKAFWGEYNIIEPEKPIESAIKKIQKRLEKNKK